MSYAIFRSQGIKTLHELSQKGGHNKRTKEKYQFNPNIKIEDSKNNIEIIKCNKYVDKFYEMTKEYQKEHSERMKNMKSDRKKSFYDIVNNSKSVVADEMIFTSDKDFFKNLSKEELIKWADKTMNFIYEDLGYTKEQVVHAVIHMDEKVSHLHCVVVPLVKKYDKRTDTTKYTISKCSYIKDNIHLSKLQEDKTNLLNFINHLLLILKEFFRYILLSNNKKQKEKAIDILKECYDNNLYNSVDLKEISKDTDSEIEVKDFINKESLEKGFDNFNSRIL